MTKKIETLSGDKPHSAIEKMVKDYKNDKVERREFLRTATMLGVTAASAYSLIGLTQPSNAMARVKKGGTMRYALQVLESSDPANWVTFEQANIGPNVCDYLCVTGIDGVTRPSLAESWKASENLKTWTFKIRKDVKFHNGDSLDASDIKHNIERWTAKDSKSSNKALFSSIKKIILKDKYTIVLKLNTAVLAIPENFYNYPTAILHKSFDGKTNWSQNAIGTGPFKLVSYKVGQKVKLVRNDKYWGDVAHLDAITFHDLGNKSETAVAAIASNQIDAIYVNFLT